MALRVALVAGLLLALAPVHAAEVVSCPQLAAVVQVGACPTEADLDQLTDAVCADDPICINAFQVVRERKKTARWETEDGRFAGYFSCTVPVEKIRTAALEGLLLQKTGLTVIGCLYEHDLSMEYRTKSTCTTADGKVVGTDGEQRLDCRTARCDFSCE